MKRHILLFFLFCLCGESIAQITRSLSEHIKTVRVVVNNDPLQPPVARVGAPVEISFDELSHDYIRYIWKVEFCNADWTPADEVFESDYLSGFNGRPIEDYETSFNTTVLYTHYRFGFPSADARLLLPGNYRVRVYSDERDASPDPVLEACFSLLTPEMSVALDVSSNTDVDFNQRHQQVSYSVSYGQRRVVDPRRELHTVVLQNRRQDNAVVDLPPNIQKSTGVEWTHRRELIFPAGAEYHKFEIQNVQLNGMGVDRMLWQAPDRHAILFPVDLQHNYTYDQDANGAYVIRAYDDESPDTQAEYIYVHFILHCPRLPGGDVYVTGLWDNGFPDPRCRMEYIEEAGVYECSVLLKQGYYNYQFRQLNADGVGQTARTEGDFFETENEYLILVYHRPQGARYDALVGYSKVNFNGNR